MADFDFKEFSGKAADATGNAAGKVKDFTLLAVHSAKRLGRKAKLTLEINAQKDIIKKNYLEIGKLYYETRKDAPEGFFVQLCEEVSAAMAEIEAREAEIASMKTDDAEPAADADFEAVVEETAAEAPAEESPAEESAPEAPVEEAPAEEPAPEAPAEEAPAEE